MWRSGGEIIVFLKTIEVQVSWNGVYRITVTVSTNLRNKVCGLCGTYNMNPNDDLKKKNGEVTRSVEEFGNSWETDGSSCPNSGKRNAIANPGCSTDPSVIQEGQKRCAVLMGEVFSGCNSVLNPKQYITNCEYDYCCCSGEDKEECYCDNLSTYAAACADAGVTLSAWRNSFCRELTIMY